MKAGVASRDGSIHDGFEMLVKSPYSKADYRMRGPVEEWGARQHQHRQQEDCHGAYQMRNVGDHRQEAARSQGDRNSQRLGGAIKKVSGMDDGVLASGLQGFKFVNAAELIRTPTPAGRGRGPDVARRRSKIAWLPTIEHYAYFANGNWETAALQTKMAIAVFCNDRELFESGALVTAVATAAFRT